MNEYGWNIERKGLFTLQYNCLFTLNLANMVKFTLVLLNTNQYRCESSLNHHLKLCPCKKNLILIKNVQNFSCLYTIQCLTLQQETVFKNKDMDIWLDKDFESTVVNWLWHSINWGSLEKKRYKVQALKCEQYLKVILKTRSQSLV